MGAGRDFFQGRQWRIFPGVNKSIFTGVNKGIFPGGKSGEISFYPLETNNPFLLYI